MNKDNYTLSIIIPCYNEKDSIENIVKKVKEAPVANAECFDIGLPDEYVRTVCEFGGR